MKRFTDEQIKKWVDTHDLRISGTDARCAFEDAHSTRALSVKPYWNCPCGFSGGSRNIRQHRANCDTWKNKSKLDPQIQDKPSVTDDAFSYLERAQKAEEEVSRLSSITRAPALTTADIERLAEKIYWGVCQDGYLEKSGLRKNVAAIAKILTETLTPKESPVQTDRVDRAVLYNLVRAHREYLNTGFGQAKLQEALKQAEIALGVK